MTSNVNRHIRKVNKFQLHKNILAGVSFPPCLIKLNWWIFFPKHMSIILPCDYYCCNCISKEWSWILGCLFLDKVFSVRLQFYFFVKIYNAIVRRNVSAWLGSLHLNIFLWSLARASNHYLHQEMQIVISIRVFFARTICCNFRLNSHWLQNYWNS